jgi:hypothetical protein
MTEEKSVSAHLTPPAAKSASFIRQYGWFMLPIVILAGAVFWLVAWNWAARGTSSLYWIYLHLDATTALNSFYLFILLALAVVILLLLWALFRKQAHFSWR